MRDRLISLLCDVECAGSDRREGGCGYRDSAKCNRIEKLDHCMIACIADHLLANGVIVPPCKVGDVVYRVCKQKYPVDSYRMNWEEDWVILTRPFDLSMIPEIGKTVFITREEAKRALKEKE